MTSDAQFNAALDRFTVPGPSSDLAARIAEAAASRTASLPPAPRRSGRGLWVRTRRAVIGVAAFSVMSATAAASGLFGERMQIPVISTIVEQVAPAPIAPQPPKRAVAAPVAPKASPQTAEPIALPPLPPSEEIAGTPQAKRLAAADRVADKMEARLTEIDARRAAKGLPPNTAPRRALLEQLKAAKTDEERRIALQAIKSDNERLRIQHAARKGVEPAPKTNQRQRAAVLTEEERHAMRTRIKQDLPPNATPEERKELAKRLRREMLAGRPAPTPAPGTPDAEGESSTVEGR